MGSHKVSPQPTVNMQLLLGLLAQCSLLLALPTSDLPEVDTRVVNKPDQQRKSPAITGSLVQDVKQINILLNIPNGCNVIYDSMINQLRNCREGSDRGHDQCKNSKLSFPTDEETPWHPEPSCDGEYCQESSKLEFSDRTAEETNVAFPDEKPY